jgi:3-oxoacyl-[acyl-carrier protein] reductase
MVAEVARTLGPVDTLVINASIDFPTVPFTGLEWKDFEAKVMGEMRAAFFPLKAVVPSMIEARRGCIVGISSGLSRQPGFGFSAHSTAKSGLDALMKSLALELGPHGIRVNTVAPGLTLTDATARMPEEHKRASAARAPLRRNGVAGDVAGAVLMLASDESRFVTGAYVPVSGGNQMI